VNGYDDISRINEEMIAANGTVRSALNLNTFYAVCSYGAYFSLIVAGPWI